MSQAESSMTESVQSVQEGGNTNPPPSASKRWCFTWNNYDRNDIVQCVQGFEKLKGEVIWIIGEEVAETGTEHLQGYAEAEVRWRPSQLGTWWKKAHWEKAKGNRMSNLRYCSKEGSFLHSKNVRVPKPKFRVKREHLREQQTRIADLFKEDCSPWCRKIYWFWEAQGNWGKTILTKYMVHNMDAIVLDGAKGDMLCGLVLAMEKWEPPIVIFDLPRGAVPKVDYTGIEKVKDSLFFSTKYESAMGDYNKPHVIVFANSPPMECAMSADRWIVEELPPSTPTESGGVEREEVKLFYKDGVFTL